MHLKVLKNNRLKRKNNDMKKTTLFLFSLFLTIGTMAQNYRFEEIDIKSNADAMLYSNAPCTVTTWGDDFRGWHVLFDNDPETIFHSEYGSGTSVDGLDHYLRVDLGEGNELTTFKFTFTTRNKNSEVNSPTTIVVEGSNDANGPYTGIKTITGISQQNSYKYESEVLGNANNAYRYIRFRVTATGSYENQTDGGGKKFFFISEFGMSRAIRNGYVHNTGTSVHSERKLNSFTITDGTNSLNVTSIQPAVRSSIYVDMSGQKLTTKAGSTLYFSAFDWSGSWMHAYAYIDYNQDCFFKLENNNDGTGTGEIVSYNYYDGRTITGDNGNTDGNAIKNDYNGSKAMPAFTLPVNLQPGEYRLRIKIDWNNLDADYGDTSLVGGSGTNKNNQKIVDNGGCQCDITLVVESASVTPRRVSVVAGAGGSVSIAGETGTEVETVGMVNIIATPDYGYGFVNWKNGEEIVSTAASYMYNGEEEAEFVAEFRRLSIDEQYTKLSQPTFTQSDGNITEIAQIEFNNRNITGFHTALGTTTRLNETIKVKAGETYNLTIGYELHWGDISLYQIDNNGTQTKYGPYLCEWESGANPLNILKRDNPTMYEDFDLTSLDDFNVDTSGSAPYIWLPYEITIDEDHNFGDLVVVRIVVASENYVQGRCFDILLEVAQQHTLSVSAAGWASLYLDFPAAIPDFGDEDEEAGVYIVTGVRDGGYLNLVKVTEGVLPANTGVIVKAAQDTYDFIYSEDEQADVVGNLLLGTVTDELIEGHAYVLGNKNGIGFYQAILNYNATYNKITNEADIEQYGVYFKNNNHKAYLLASALAPTMQSNAGYRFAFGGTTAVEEVEMRNGKGEIYDLTGRKLSEITKPGIYIINGKKVIIR